MQCQAKSWRLAVPESGSVANNSIQQIVKSLQNLDSESTLLSYTGTPALLPPTVVIPPPVTFDSRPALAAYLSTETMTQ